MTPRISPYTQSVDGRAANNRGVTGLVRLMRFVVGTLLVVAVLAPGTALAQEDETGEAIRGTLRAEGEPVEGVTIVAFDADGTEVGRAESDSDGDWRIPLPGPGQYAATLDEDSLPEDVGLRDPERGTLEFSLRTGQERTLLFPLGEDERALAGFLQRASQSLVNGIKFGLIIAICAIGLSLIFGTTSLVNFAHGEMVTFGAVLAFFINVAAGPGSLLWAAPLAVMAGAALGAGMERGLWRPLRNRKTGLIQLLVISIGLSLLLRNAIQFFYGGRSRPYLDYAVQRAMEFGWVRITPRDLTVIVLSLLVLTGVGLLLLRTRLGKAMRAVSDNRDLAESSGIDVQRVILVIWLMGGGLAALGGVFLGVVENVSYLMGFRLLLLMFAGVILGGLGTAFGALVGSLVVGIVTEMSTLWFSTELKFVWALGIMALVLLLRPQGILGVKERIG
jgi:neutral amino acid transport system permease protein